METWFSKSFVFLYDFPLSLVDELGLLEEAASILGKKSVSFLSSVYNEKKKKCFSPNYTLFLNVQKSMAFLCSYEVSYN